VANVTEVINRNATGIHPNLSIMKRDELLFFTCHGVIDAKRHRFILTQIPPQPPLPTGRQALPKEGVNFLQMVS
jgi:hypothetical protein